MARMVKRSTPQWKLDEKNFPIRIKLIVPERGFGKRMDAMYEWLGGIDDGSYAWHGGGWSGDYLNRRQATALYFRSIDDAHGFVKAFPDLELADDVR